MREFLLAAAAAALGLIVCAAAAQGQAQGYPSRPVRIIGPFAPGGSSDVLARIVAQKLTEAWSAQVLVENRLGAAGMIGADYVAKSAPDGYTMLMGTIGTNASNAFIFQKMAYDTAKDFAPITQVATVPSVLAVHPSLPVKSVRELIVLARARPGELNYPTGGTGSAQHLMAELFCSMVGVRMTHVPYKGMSAAATDLLGGQTQVTFGDMIVFLPHVKSGKLRGLAVTSARRSAVLPELPPIAESGVPGYDASAWYGLFAPAGTPPDVVLKLSDAVAKIVRQPDVVERMASLGAEPVGDKPEAYAAFIRSEMSRWSKVVKDAGIRAE